MNNDKFIHIHGHAPYINTATINIIFSTYDKDNNLFILEILCDSNLENGRYEFKFDTFKLWQQTRKNILRQWTKWHFTNVDDEHSTNQNVDVRKSYLTLYDTEDKNEHDPTEWTTESEDDLKTTEHLYVVDVMIEKIQSISLTDVLIITTTCGSQIMVHEPTHFKAENMAQFVESMCRNSVIEC